MTIRPDSTAVQIQADLWLLDDSGNPVAEIQGFCLRATPSSTVQRLFKPAANLRQHCYRLEWQLQAQSDHTIQQQKQSWLILADQTGVGETLAELLRRHSQTCTVVSAEEFENLSSNSFRALFKQISSPPQHILHCWSLSSLSSTQSNTFDHSLNPVLSLIQALAQQRWSPRLWLLTCGAQTIDQLESAFNPLASLSQQAFWGLSRVIRLEYPNLHCTCLDLDPHHTSLTDVLTDLLAQTPEPQIAYRQNHRYVARLVSDASSESILRIPDTESFRLQLSSDSVLDQMALVPADRRAPKAGEVEIQVRAAGLNFRDVLNALGVLKPFWAELGLSEAAAVPLGWECAGTISAVGSGVTDWQVGDAVIAVATPGSLAQFVTVSADLITAKPDSLSFAEAATIPTAFLTAYHGLHDLAQLQAGERVLIHAAAGGVGQAAVQLAQLAGAEVLATASPSKWKFLQSCGVDQVMNSRTLEFAEQISALTEDQGVDVVLNSLNGEFIPRNLEILAPNGRLVEIGKVGIWTAAQVQQVRPDVAYLPFDLLEVSQQHPGQLTAMLRHLMPLFQQGKLKPLPTVTYNITESVQAFRTMAQARHIGKVVITIPNRLPHHSAVRSDGSYLITGGLGGLGLQVARWLAERGAGQLILVGRQAPTPETAAILQRLQQQGTAIQIGQADVTCAGDLEKLAPLADFPIRGVIHAAGVIEDGLLAQQTWNQFQRVMQVKIQGGWNLHRISQSWPLDFFVCFSSIASLLGSVGQGNYAAANAFLDGLVQYRRRLGLPGLSINWGPWAEAGMAARLREVEQQQILQSGIQFISPDQGVQILEQFILEQQTQMMVLPVNWTVFSNRLPQHAMLLAALKAQAPDLPSTVQSPEPAQVSAAPQFSAAELQQQIRLQLAKVLGFSHPDAIDPQENFADLGMDSLMAVEFKNRLEALVGYAIPQTLPFDYPTVAALSHYFFQQQGSDRPAAEPSAPTIQADQPAAAQASAAGADASPVAVAMHPVVLPVVEPSAEESETLEIAAADYQFELMPEYLTLRADLDRVEQLGNPFFGLHEGTARETTRINQRELISYSSYNYLGMSGDPFVNRAAQTAIEQYGTSVSASRVVAGERPIHRQLEQEIARLIGTEDCIIYVGGHATNVTTIGHLFGDQDLILYDALSHNSIRQGCDLSRATAIEFPHNDWHTLEALLKQHRQQYRKVLIAVEGIYSTDGDLSPLPQIVTLKQRYKTFLLVDEAHSIGVLGRSGRGISEHFGIPAHQVDLWMGTLSKSLASCGGYIAGCKAVVEYLKYTAPGFVYSVGMSPANTAAALAALQLLQKEPERVATLHARSQYFLRLAQQQGLNTGNSHDSPVIPILVGEPYRAVQLGHALFQRGINVQPMVYPSVPYNAARLRFFITCLHTEAQIWATIQAVSEELSNL